jgi:hypothetical protein
MLHILYFLVVGILLEKIAPNLRLEDSELLKEVKGIKARIMQGK